MPDAPYLRNPILVTRGAESVVRRSLRVNRGDLLLPITSTTAESLIGKASVLMAGDEVFLCGDAIAMTPNSDNILSAYLMYVLNSAGFERWKMLCVSGTTIRHLNPKSLMNVAVPAPPIEVQREIVRILDSFQELEAVLVAEMEARRKQFAYYRDNLLAFPELTSASAV